MPGVNLSTKWYVFGFGQAFAGGFVGAFVVGGTIAPEIISSPAHVIGSGLILGVVGALGWYAHLKNPYEPDTVSIKHLPEEERVEVKKLLLDNGLTDKGKTQ
jgi:hypothetical protein